MSDLTPMSPQYAEWLTELRARIHSAQLRAALAVNRELVLLYWQSGRDILERQGREGWGARVIDRLSRDLCGAFPEMKGFSPRNLKYMKAFAEAWPDVTIVQQAAAQLPWFHLCTLIDKLKSASERDWYLARAIEHGWSRNMLVVQIETRLRERSGQAPTNFQTRLPGPLSELARESLKDPYRLDFLGIGSEAMERGGRGICAARFQLSHRRRGVSVDGGAPGGSSDEPPEHRSDRAGHAKFRGFGAHSRVRIRVDQR